MPVHIIIIMDELALPGNRTLLSSVFSIHHTSNQKFLQIVQNQNILVSVTSYLSVGDVLNLGLSCKQVRHQIEKKASIQNRILKAQVKYLTDQENNKLGNGHLKGTHSNSAYLLFESYWDSLPLGIDERMERMTKLTGGIKRIFSIKEQLQRALKNKEKKVVPKSNTPIQPAIDVKQAQKTVQFINLSSSEPLPSTKDAKKKSQQLLEKYKTFKKMPNNKQREFIIEKLKENNIPYIANTEILSPDESLISRQQTFWDRVKRTFTPSF